MDDMKLKTHDANGNMKQLPQILDEMEAGMKGWTQEQRNAALATIFGKEHLASWQILVHKGGKDLNKMADDAKNATGEVKHLSDQMRDTPENQFKRLQQTLHSIAVTFGTEILPALMPVVQEVQKFVEWIANLDSGTKQMILTIAAVVAVVGPLVILLGSLISAFGTIVTAAGSVISIFGGLGTATAAVGTASVGAAAGVGGIGAALGAATLAAAPWIAAAVAVGAAGYGIYKALN
ncbi:phage tail tape measure protein, partial [Bacillus thuringiensis]